MAIIQVQNVSVRIMRLLNDREDLWPYHGRIDIQKEVHPVDFFAIADQKSGASSEELRTKVEKARKIQQERYAQEKGPTVMRR